MKTVSDCFRGPKFNGVKASLNVMNSILSISPAAAVISTSYKNELKKVKDGLAAIYKTASTSYSTKPSDETTKLLLAFNNSKTLAENIGKSTGMLENLEAAYQNRKNLLDWSPEIMPEEILRICENEGLSEWKNPRRLVNEMIADYERLNKVAKSIRNDGLIEMTKIFEEAAGIRGLPGSEGQKSRISSKIVENIRASKTYKNQKHTIIKNISELFIKIEALDLDFAKNQGRLKNAKVTVTSLMNYFDEIFGNSKQKTVTIEKQVNLSWIVILGLSIGIFFSILIGLIAIYGLTKSGRAKYRNIYMYYFGKPEDFEKRWRYSNFMDTINGKNALLDAVREENKPNLLKALKNGAYIDAYNKFGNTALHVATKLGHPEFVELLIKYGADRSLLNYKNLRPMQLIPYDKNDLPEHKAKCDQIKKIYKKYENKAFRCSFPQVFPSSSFHIYMDDSTDVKLCNSFIDKFPGITTDEITSNITHCVVKVDSNGVFETDRLDLLQKVFHGEIIVKEQWMTDCLNDEKLIEQDYKYLVEEIKFNGVVYKSVLQWTEAMAKGTMPYLVGACVVFVFKAGYPNLAILTEIIKAHGGYVLSQFPQKEHFNVNSHPYLHSHLGPLFVLHDGSTDLTVYKNDADRMYTVFDEQEFVEFMLKRDIHRDNTEKPIAVMIGDE
ncbi:hypothetical protein CRE_18418 [Caenorhabditis remanei]|uniref:BRCT domain-containing protein n=1 Tax=Caenorhabditis remanei TaxID=31234 RepID=E3LK51_CAERE|nr:hypothetical protein CRE_18418 [Caenorhabditis remanei]